MKRKRERVLGPYADRTCWRVVTIDAQGHRESQSFDSEAKAERYVEILRADLASDEHTSETALAAYKQHLLAKGNKADSIRQTCWAIGLFFNEDVQLSALTAKRCQSLYDELRGKPTRTGRPLSVDSHRGILAQVRSFLAWCSSRGWLRANPVENVHGVGKRRPRGKSLGQAGHELRIKEARAWYGMAVFLAHRGDSGAVAALVALLLGMRASEVTTRKVADLDQDASPGDLLWIPCSKTPAGRRTLEVPAVLRPYLLRCCEGKGPERYIFEAEAGRPHWRDWILHNVRRICVKAGVPRVTAHAMRGLLATITAQRGLAGHLIAATLGHEDVRTTMNAYAAPGAAAAGAGRRGLVLLQGGQESKG